VKLSLGAGSTYHGCLVVKMQALSPRWGERADFTRL
jgi:hypothetical protein